ncbi:MAG TPA: T9SS type A sorting domain-containing protein, partial [Flavobacteriales bacterium]|nr:T9SS type A sorting domain-containing protein [Flavobacteriales bacterium]
VSTQDYKSASNITFEINETAGIYIVEVYSQQGSAAKFRVIIQ